MKLQNLVKKNTYCINLKTRKEKKQWMKKQCKKLKLHVNFFDAVKNTLNPAKGCLQSHLKIIMMAKRKNLPYVLILEDDCKFTQKNLDLPELPKEWEMLYLGGNVDDVYTEKQSAWMPMACWTTHSYIIHNSIYDFVIEHLSKYEKEVDRFYKDIVHTRKKSFMLSYHLTIQREGYSDIQGSNVSYAMFTPEDKVVINEADHESDSDGNYRLKLNNFSDNELPYVSILTPTKNRRKFFPMAIYNFKKFVYPKEKIEWVIVDDGEEDLSDLLPKDERIKYVKIQPEGNLTIAMKRNLCVKYAKYDYFVHMDDDDYYNEFSVMSRIRTLLTYPDKDIVGCGMCCCYDTTQKQFYIVGNKYQLAEASMAYTRKFFDERNYNENVKLGEGLLFIKKRKYKALRIPYSFIILVMNHKTNVTNSIRKRNDERFYIQGPVLPENIRPFIEKI
jgi:GR25 family glycosyltransferase involved in LPS biosynthesis